MTTPGLRLKTPEKNGDQITWALNYLNDFLGLSSLMAFTLVCIGLHYYYKSQSDRWSSEVALLKYLGVSKNKIFFAFFYFMSMIAIGGTIVTLALSVIIKPILLTISTQYLGDSFAFNTYWQTPFIVLIVALIGNLSLALPIIMPVLKSKCSAVFNETSSETSKQKTAIYYLPFFLFMIVMAIWLSNSITLGLSFIGVLLGLMLVTAIIAAIVLKISAKLADKKRRNHKIINAISDTL